MEQGQRISVNGIAVREGVSLNDIYYSKEELSKFAPTLIGRPILKDHKSETDNVIGLVESAMTLDGGDTVQYTGWVKEDGSGIIEKIQDGRCKEVSIGAVVGRLVKESEDSTYMIAKDMKAMELSTTPTPGVNGTKISQAYNSDGKQVKSVVENFDSFKAIDKSHSSEQSDIQETIRKEEINMEGKEIKTVSQEAYDKMKAKLDAYESKEFSEIKARYSKVCETLKIVEKTDLSLKEMSMLVEQLESIKMQKEEVAEVEEEEKEEEAKEEVKEEEAKVEETEVKTEETETPAEEAEVKVEDKPEEKTVELEPESKAEVVPEEVSKDAFEGYVLSKADSVGMSFYRA